MVFPIELFFISVKAVFFVWQRIEMMVHDKLFFDLGIVGICFCFCGLKYKVVAKSILIFVLIFFSYFRCTEMSLTVLG